jgi:hypothetical protein
MSKAVSFSLPLWGRAGVGAPGLRDRRCLSTARCPHPDLPPEGEGAKP